MKKILLVKTIALVALFVGSFSTNASAGLCGSSTNPNNTCEGAFSGNLLATGTNNSFFGSSAGQNEIGGQANSYFGSLAGFKAIGAQRNSFFGAFSGTRTTGSNNTYIGTQSGANNDSGSYNAFFGDYSGFSNVSGTYNTMLGRGTDVGFDNLTHATAVGAGSEVTASNTIQLGRDGLDVTRLSKLGTGGNIALCLNSNGEISSCAIVSALKTNTSSQDAKIKEMSKVISKQQGQIEALRNTICSDNKRAAVCR